MAKTPASRRSNTATFGDQTVTRGNGGETHQTAEQGYSVLTDAQGHPIADDQNTLKQGARGPALIVDWWGDVMGKPPTDIVRETLSKHWPMPFSRLAEKVVEALAPTHQIGTLVSNMRAAGATGPLVVVEDGDRTYVMELDKYLAR